MDAITGDAPLPAGLDHRNDCGPFDIIGDVHGCLDELIALLVLLEYETSSFSAGGENLVRAHHPEGRRVIFVGDFADRGPRNVDVFRLVMGMHGAGTALAVAGNHDMKLRRWIEGRNVQVAYGLDATISDFKRTSEAFRKRVATFIGQLPLHLLLDGGGLVVAHAGLREDLHGMDNNEARSFALFGDTTGARDDYGFPVRREWGRTYSGEACVVYGHTPMLACEWINRTICIDTGCVFGGELTALRWPEKELVAVPAIREYWAPTKPLGLRSEAPG